MRKFKISQTNWLTEIEIPYVAAWGSRRKRRRRGVRRRGRQIQQKHLHRRSRREWWLNRWVDRQWAGRQRRRERGVEERQGSAHGTGRGGGGGGRGRGRAEKARRRHGWLERVEWWWDWRGREGKWRRLVEFGERELICGLVNKNPMIAPPPPPRGLLLLANPSETSVVLWEREREKVALSIFNLNFSGRGFFLYISNMLKETIFQKG